jgi:EAL domain-containing protein (putative c-di-GMP-specific phosphodiesterase class I)
MLAGSGVGLACVAEATAGIVRDGLAVPHTVVSLREPQARDFHAGSDDGLIVASLTVPIRGSTVAGALVVDDVRSRTFTSDEIAFAEACAMIVATVSVSAFRRTRAEFESSLAASAACESAHVVLAVDGCGDDARVASFAEEVGALFAGALLGRSDATTLLVGAPLRDGMDAYGAAEKLRDAVRGTTIGVSRMSLYGTDAAAAVGAALRALGAARADAAGAIRVYEPRMDAAARMRHAIGLDLRNAVANGEFFLVYQPIVDARRGAICAFEALVRWNHPQAGLIPPNEFIPIAESTGEIVPLTRFVLQEAVKQCRAWQRFARRPVPVSINVSTIDLDDVGFVDAVIEALTAANLPASLLTIEVTESMLMQDVSNAHATLVALRAIGIRTSLDDFGTGYSSLAYLKRLPFDSLKIDRAFVRELATSHLDRAVADAIVAVAKKFTMHVVAEGVETSEQAAILENLGCDMLQGYLYSKPVGAHHIESVMRALANDASFVLPEVEAVDRAS